MEAPGDEIGFISKSGPIPVLLSLQMQVRSRYLKSQSWKEQESGPLHTGCNLRCYLLFLRSFRSRAARVHSHVSSWLHGAQRQSSKGKSKPETAPCCVNESRITSGNDTLNLMCSGVKGHVRSQPCTHWRCGPQFKMNLGQWEGIHQDLATYY